MTSVRNNISRAKDRASSGMFPQRLQEFAARFDARFKELLTTPDAVPPELLEAVHYAALAPGKRIRPYLVTRCCELAGGHLDDAWPAAAAVECIHAFSLVHDDLPAMDDDDVRRGRPACHRKFDEATAILAGDALVVLAFELLARHVSDPSLAVRMVAQLARASGWSGMIGGQLADLLGERQPPSRETVTAIHERKTARLFAAACRLGAMAGTGSSEVIESLGRFGERVGCAFQIADDLLDVTAATGTLGKAAGKDAPSGKQTLPRCVGMDESRAAARDAAEAGIAALEPFGAAADDLRALAHYVVSRDY